MFCPKCGGKTRTYDTRPKSGNTNWRRKRCEKCDYRFTTIELTAAELAKHIRTFDSFGNDNTGGR